MVQAERFAPRCNGHKITYKPYLYVCPAFLHNQGMEPQVQADADGTLTIRITLPAATGEMSMLAQEERLMEAINAVGRAGAKHLLGGFDAPGQPLLQAGRKWTSKGKVAKIYETPWGEVLLERHLYQHSGGGATLCPLETRARIVGGTATPHLGRSLGHKYAHTTRAPWSAIWRRTMPASWLHPMSPISRKPSPRPPGNPSWRTMRTRPRARREQVASAVLGLDGTCALFCEEGFKQCMVGTIALYDGAGERLETLYLGQAPEMGKAQFLDRLDREWQRVCQSYPAARKVGLSDGARDYEPWLAARTTWQILDFYHASGYLAGAAPGLVRDQAGRAAWLEAACHALKHESGAAQRLAGELAAQVEAGARTRGAAPALAAASGYFAHNVERMNYAVCGALHLPIGSGVTEAACKSLVKLRLCGSGMKWTRSGAQTVLTLRALLLSTSRWSSLWQYFDQHGLPSA